MRKYLENSAYVTIFLKKTTRNFRKNWYFMKILKNFEET